MHCIISLRENDFQRPAKGGSTPAFACQHAAIAPLPCPNLQLVSQRQSSCELASFKTCNCSRKSLLRIQFAPQMWAARPHLANIFKKLLDQKTFISPVARILSHALLTNTNSPQQRPINSKLPGQPFLSVSVQSDSENSEPLSVLERHKCP